MRVTNVRAYRIPTGGVRPVIVEVQTDEGITGWGEAAVAYGLGARAAVGMVADLAPRIIGADPRYPRHVYHDLYDNAFWTKGGGAIVFAAMSALDTALWDIKARALSVPIHTLFGAAFNASVPVYANGWNYDYDDSDAWARAVERPLNDGYTIVKAYPFASKQPGRTLIHVKRRSLDESEFDRSVKRIRQLCGIVKDSAKVLIDFSGGLNRDQMLYFLHLCQDEGVHWVEEPCDAFDVAGLGEIAGRFSFPIAAGERVYTRSGFRNLLETGRVDVVMPDIGNCGGVFEFVQIAAMAEAYNARVSPHNCASTLCTAASLQVWAASANAFPLEVYPYLPESAGYVQVLKDPPEARIRNGMLPMTEKVGIGADVDREALAPYLDYDYLAYAA